MGSWFEVARDADAHHGVTSVRRAQELGVSAATFHRRTSSALGWRTPHPGVRVAPTSVAGVKRDLVVAAHAITGDAAAAGRAGAWLHDLRRTPPDRLEVVAGHRGQLPALGSRYALRRARWLRPDDVVEVDGVPVLAVPALIVSAARWSQRDLRALVIDAVHRGQLTLDQLERRLATVGPTPGVGAVRVLARDLAGRLVESIFHDEVLTELERLGYHPAREPTRIDTPDGRGLLADIALPWHVAAEPEGDAFHRTREQRRKDRRRAAQYAGTAWVYVPIDWRDWHLDRDAVLAALDAAVLAQWRAGHGRHVPLPVHLRDR